MRFELYKILDSRFVDDFKHGYLFMNTLNYFRGIEGNSAQNDPMEGVCGSIRKNQLRQYGFYFDPDLVDAIKGNVSLLSDYYGLNSLFCLYQMMIDDENKAIEAPTEELCKFNDKDSDSKVVIRIKDTKSFLDRLAAAIDKGVQDHNFEYGIYGSVVYGDSWINADGPGTRSAFHKEPEYSYQNEWRICLLRNALVDAPYKFYVGDLSDIIEIIPLQEFLTHPEKPYPGYSVVKRGLVVQQEPFRIFGSIDAVNHLMYSYIAPHENKPVRSDQAQADWHYAKYLQLSGEPQNIDPYLDTCMRKYQDLDHLELLVQHRLSNGEWVEATDAYMYFIDHLPDVIKEEPARFFFSLHTILMQHREAADAGKLLKIAMEKYDLPDDVILVMQSDVLFALGFYDQVIPVFLKMQESSKDPILDFYLAVSYFHTLDFEKAHQHLTNYESYFAHSPDAAQRTTRLRSLVNCFRNDEMMAVERSRHAFEDLHWDNQLETLLCSAQQKHAFLGIDVLYQLEVAHKWDLIERFQTITVCPLTIDRAIFLYTQSGDPVFYHIVLHLSSLSHIRISSPQLDYFLALDASGVDMPAYMKMERALYLQETKQSS